MSNCAQGLAGFAGGLERRAYGLTGEDLGHTAYCACEEVFEDVRGRSSC